MNTLIKNYFDKNIEKNSFHINDISQDLNISVLLLKSQIDDLLKENPSMGIFNSKTGLFMRKNPVYGPVRKRNFNGFFIILVMLNLIFFSPPLFFPLFYVLAIIIGSSYLILTRKRVELIPLRDF